MSAHRVMSCALVACALVSSIAIAQVPVLPASPDVKSVEKDGAPPTSVLTIPDLSDPYTYDRGYPYVKYNVLEIDGAYQEFNTGVKEHEGSVFIGTRILQDAEGICWKEVTQLLRTVSFTLETGTVDTPETRTRANVVDCPITAEE